MKLTRDVEYNLYNEEPEFVTIAKELKKGEKKNGC